MTRQPPNRSVPPPQRSRTGDADQVETEVTINALDGGLRILGSVTHRPRCTAQS
jgi:hypothetical protein